MIYDGQTWHEKIEAEKQWHDWFAWHSVSVSKGKRAWLEVVERRRVGSSFGVVVYEYRRRGSSTVEEHRTRFAEVALFESRPPAP